jgi:hypothetical protein
MAPPRAQHRDDRIRFAADALRSVKPSEYAVRFGFGAAISAGAAILALAFGDRVGGLFLAFPAILPATLTLIQKREGRKPAVADAHAATIGAVAMVGFALVAALVFRASAPLAVPAALGTWVIVSLVLFVAVRLLAHRT